MDESRITSFEALAKALGVTDRTFRRWRKRPDLQDLLPPMKDGTFDVPAWRALAEQKGLLQAVEANHLANLRTVPEAADERALRLRRETLRLEREEFELAKVKGQSLPLAEFQAALGQMLAAFRATLNRLPARAASKLQSRARAAFLRMFKQSLSETQFRKVQTLLDRSPAIDFADLEEALQAEVDKVLSTLHTCDFLIPKPLDEL